MPSSASVLFVDDDEGIRRVAQAMLTALGHPVVMAGDGAQAVALYREQRAEISLVIMDLMMPHHDGATALAALRTIDPGVRVVFTSGFSDPDLSTRTGGHLPDGFLPKPFNLQTLRTCLEAWLEPIRPA